ncbi:recombinase family protein [Azohydromonas lata]|uniref:Recombinase family protein n=1 Tax=Azohydromonas lata TaxID=45677 RepID=A0ABU5IDC5_9BURK|nr:recombinase family protein [Azohydromonas lata]MDZ5456967.1 recombinase family protein [Azohydromonas lata]
MKATIYARFSTDMQSESSIEGQERLCRQRAESEGWTVTAIRADRAVSGQTPVDSRPAGKLLLADVAAGRLQVLLLEGLDRLSRDQVEQERVVRRLEYAGVRIVGVSDGYDSTMCGSRVMRGVRGLINDIFVDDLRKKVHRGISVRAARGLYTGSVPPYGYRIVRTDEGRVLEIDEDQAATVRWAFERFAAGDNLYTLASTLNARGVPSPGGKQWDAAYICGSMPARPGLLQRELYIGRLSWNRTQYLRDPETGKRSWVARPVDEWIVTERPELRIVDEATWSATRARLAAGGPGRGVTKGAKSLLSRLLRCPHCAGAMLAVSSARYGCAARARFGPTACQGYYVRRDIVERRLLAHVREQLLTPAAAMAFEAEFKKAIAAHRSQADEQALQRRRRELEGEIRRLVDGIAAVGVSPALASRLQAAEAELEGVGQSLLLLNRPVAVPNVRELFARKLMDLGTALEQDMRCAREMLREILEDVFLELDGEAVYAVVQTARLELLVANGVSTAQVAGTCPTS